MSMLRRFLMGWPSYLMPEGGAAGAGGDGGGGGAVDTKVADAGANGAAADAGAADAGKGAAGDGKGAADAGASGRSVDAGGADGKGAAAGDGKSAAGAADGKGAAADSGKGTWWNDGWRDGYAKGDAKKAERLARYASPEAVVDSLLSLQAKIGSGELRSQLPKNATAEQLKAWREEHGIPLEPAAYKLDLGKDIQVTDEDKPIVDTILGVVHQSNGTNDLANAMVRTYYDVIEKRLEERTARDHEFAQAEEDALRAEYGNDYRQNMNMVKGLLDMAPAGVRELIARGRLANGDPLLAHRDSMKWLVGLARQINPVSALVPGGGANVGSAIEDEIKTIHGWMQAPRNSVEGKKYWADEKVQERYRELLDAKERLAANARA